MVTSHSTKEFYVYVLKNPLKKYERFYVGKGTGNRWMCHFKESKSSNPSRHYNPFKDKTIEEIQAPTWSPSSRRCGTGGMKITPLGWKWL